MLCSLFWLWVSSIGWPWLKPMGMHMHSLTPQPQNDRLQGPVPNREHMQRSATLYLFRWRHSASFLFSEGALATPSPPFHKKTFSKSAKSLPLGLPEVGRWPAVRKHWNHRKYKIFESNIMKFPNKTIYQNISWISPWIILSILVSPKINNIRFGSHGHFHRVRKTLKMLTFGVLPKMNPKSY